jgi:hypothetical protein
LHTSDKSLSNNQMFPLPPRHLRCFINVSNFNIRSYLYFGYHIQERINSRVERVKMFIKVLGQLFAQCESDGTSAQRDGGKSDSCVTYVSFK